MASAPKQLTLTKNTAVSLSLGLVLIIMGGVWSVAVAWARVEAQTTRNTTDIQSTLEEVDLLNQNLNNLNVNIEKLNTKLED